MKKAIKFTLISSMAIPIATQFILYLPVSMDLKALLLGTNNIYFTLLIGSGVLLILSMLLVHYGGIKRFKGQLRLTPESMEFQLNKNSFRLPYSEIKRIKYQLNSDGQWEWKFKTCEGKFTIKFNQIVERYKTDNLLQDYLKDEYDRLIKKD